jgi:hypothetical protein
MPRPTALQRSDPAAVRLMVDSIFEGISGDAKQSYCEFLAASIDYLSQHHGDRWGVTLREDTNVLRLNAGIVEGLILYSGGLRVLVEKKKAPPRTRFDRRSHHRNAPGCETADIPLAELPRSLPRLAEAHHAALTIIARRPAFRKTSECALHRCHGVVIPSASAQSGEPRDTAAPATYRSRWRSKR